MGSIHGWCVPVMQVAVLVPRWCPVRARVRNRVQREGASHMQVALVPACLRVQLSIELGVPTRREPQNRSSVGPTLLLPWLVAQTSVERLPLRVTRQRSNRLLLVYFY